METHGDPENGDQTKAETLNTSTNICETPIKLEQLSPELEPNEEQCSTRTDESDPILKINIIDKNRISLNKTPAKSLNTHTNICETPNKIAPLPFELATDTNKSTKDTDASDAK